MLTQMFPSAILIKRDSEKEVDFNQLIWSEQLSNTSAGGHL